MKYKIIGAVLVFAGLLAIAKYDQHVIGLIAVFIGFYLAMKKGMKPV
jgi:hypothetical protein